MKNIIFFLFLSISLHAQSFEVRKFDLDRDNVISDCHQILDSTYIGIHTIGLYDNPAHLADSLELFVLNKDGVQRKSKKISKGPNIAYSLNARMLAVPNDPDGRVMVHCSMYFLDIFEKKGYVFCVDKDLNILWEKIGVKDVGLFEAFSSAKMQGDTAIFYGFWSESFTRNLPFFWKLDVETGSEIKLDTLWAMENRIEGNDSYVETDDYFYFFNTGNTFYKIDKHALILLDSFKIDADTMFFGGSSLLLPDNRIVVTGRSDSVLTFMPPFKLISAPTICYFDEEGNYLKRFRNFVNSDLEIFNHPIAAELDNKKENIFLIGYEFIQGTSTFPTSDWFSLTKIDLNEKIIWERYYRLGKSFKSYQMHSCLDGGVLCTGFTNLDFNWDGLLLKFDSDGNLAGLVNENTPEKQALLSKLHVYPNPTSDWLHLEKETMEETKVQIFNQLGQEVRSFDWNTLEKDVSVSDLPQGVYFLVVDNGRAQQAVKVLVER